MEAHLQEAPSPSSAPLALVPTDAVKIKGGTNGGTTIASCLWCWNFYAGDVGIGTVTPGAQLEIDYCSGSIQGYLQEANANDALKVVGGAGR